MAFAGCSAAENVVSRAEFEDTNFRFSYTEQWQFPSRTS
jgi:hypothetical protein